MLEEACDVRARLGRLLQTAQHLCGVGRARVAQDVREDCVRVAFAAVLRPAPNHSIDLHFVIYS